METPKKGRAPQKSRTNRIFALSTEMEKMVQEYLNQNPIKFSQLVHFAIEQFITKHHTLSLKPVQSRLPEKPSYIDEETGDTFSYPARIYYIGNTNAGLSKKIVEN